VLRAADLPPGRGKPFRVAGRYVAVFNDGGSFLALDDSCPHQGASLGEGTLHLGRVICPWHSWVFDVRTGECIRVPGLAVRTYATRREGEDVEVEIPDASGGGEGDEGTKAS